MPILTKYSADSLETDGNIVGTSTDGNRDGARDGTGGVGTFAETARDHNVDAEAAIQIIYSPGRGAGTYYFRRYYTVFDTSEITLAHTVNSATISLYKDAATNGGNVIMVKSTAFGGDGATALHVDDKRAYPGYSAATTMLNNVTDYSSVVDWENASTGYVSFTLTGDALADIKNNDVLIIMTVNYDHDYLYTNPGATTFINADLYYDEYTGTSRDPKLIINYAAPKPTYNNKSNYIRTSSGNINISSGNIII